MLSFCRSARRAIACGGRDGCATENTRRSPGSEHVLARTVIATATACRKLTRNQPGERLAYACPGRYWPTRAAAFARSGCHRHMPTASHQAGTNAVTDGDNSAGANVVRFAPLTRCASWDPSARWAGSTDQPARSGLPGRAMITAQRAFLATGTLADHALLWSGDGRITAGHMAVLAERAVAGPLEVILFNGVIGAGWSWSQRDEAMAGRILAGTAAGTRTLAVAGNAHTPTSPIDLGVPKGAYLARRRPDIRDIRINYGGGHYYSRQPRRFGRISPAASADTALPASWRARSRPPLSGGSGRAPAVPAVAAARAHRTLTAADAYIRCCRRG